MQPGCDCYFLLPGQTQHQSCNHGHPVCLELWHGTHDMSKGKLLEICQAAPAAGKSHPNTGEVDCCTFVLNTSTKMQQNSHAQMPHSLPCTRTLPMPDQDFKSSSHGLQGAAAYGSSTHGLTTARSRLRNNGCCMRGRMVTKVATVAQARSHCACTKCKLTPPI